MKYKYETKRHFHRQILPFCLSTFNLIFIEMETKNDKRKKNLNLTSINGQCTHNRCNASQMFTDTMQRFFFPVQINSELLMVRTRKMAKTLWSIWNVCDLVFVLFKNSYTQIEWNVLNMSGRWSLTNAYKSSVWMAGKDDNTLSKVINRIWIQANVINWQKH